MKVRAVLIAAAVVTAVQLPLAHAQVRIEIGVPAPVVVAPVVVAPVVVEPYYYSPRYCEGCWYGVWGGREGYHRGGGEPWGREHSSHDHRWGPGQRGGERHEGHGRQ